MNIFKNLKYDLTKETIDEIFSSPKIRVERITSSGQTTDWFNQDENELVILLEGEAIIQFLDKELTIKKGDVINIPSNQIHKTINLSNTCLWLCIFY